MSDDMWGPGDPAKAHPIGSTMLGDKKIDLFFGEHPHSRNDDRTYARMPNGSIMEFSGHRILINVVVESSNYLKSSGLSGDEIRKSVTGRIYADGECIYTVPGRDVIYVLQRIIGLLTELGEHSSGVMLKSERDQLPGRKIYYDRTPAIVTHFNEGQIGVQAAPGHVFKEPVYMLERDEGRYSDGSDGVSTRTTADILSPNIWWFRKTLTPGETPPIPPKISNGEVVKPS